MKFLLLSALVALMAPLTSNAKEACSPHALELPQPKEIARQVIVDLDSTLPGRTEPTYDGLRRVDPETGTLLAKIAYHFDYTTEPMLDLEYIWVKESLRRKGMARLMMAAMILDAPSAQQIYSASLIDENARAFREALASGKKGLDAIRETPAYKLNRSFGYGNIVHNRTTVEVGDLSLMVKRD